MKYHENSDGNVVQTCQINLVIDVSTVRKLGTFGKINHSFVRVNQLKRVTNVMIGIRLSQRFIKPLHGLALDNVCTNGIHFACFTVRIKLSRKKKEQTTKETGLDDGKSKSKSNLLTTDALNVPVVWLTVIGFDVQQVSLKVCLRHHGRCVVRSLLTNNVSGLQLSKLTRNTKRRNVTRLCCDHNRPGVLT